MEKCCLNLQGRKENLKSDTGLITIFEEKFPFLRQTNSELKEQC
jgi:hypothetical protein